MRSYVEASRSSTKPVSVSVKWPPNATFPAEVVIMFPGGLLSMSGDEAEDLARNLRVASLGTLGADPRAPRQGENDG